MNNTTHKLLSPTQQQVIASFLHRKTPILLVFLSIMTLTFTGCRATKKLGKTKQLTANYVTQQVNNQLLTTTSFKAKAKIAVTSPKFNQQVIAKIRLQKDSVLWMSITPVGLSIEVARVLITPDSIKVLNRLKKEYMAEGVEQLATLTNYPFNFVSLQKVLLGEMLTTSTTGTTIEIDKQAYQLIDTLAMGKITTNIDASNFTIQSIQLNDTLKNRAVTIKMEDYQPIENHTFAHKRMVKDLTNNNQGATITFSKVKANETLSFPFTISSKYQKVNINP